MDCARVALARMEDQEGSAASTDCELIRLVAHE